MLVCVLTHLYCRQEGRTRALPIQHPHVGSGLRYQILLHIFACCASPKPYGHVRIARVFLACQCVFGLAQHAKKLDTNYTPRVTAYLHVPVPLRQ